jgi:eukaryotic-like serine/threonine-protein kinase
MRKMMKLRKNILRFAALGLAFVLSLLSLAGCASQTPALGWSGMTVSGENLYTITMNGALLNINLTNGAQQKSILEQASGGGFLGCAAATNGVASYGAPVVDGGNVYITGYNGKVYRFATASNTPFPMPVGSARPIVGGAVVSGGKMYIASSDGYLYALDSSSLNQLWSFKTKAQMWTTPSLDNGTLYVGSFDKNVYAVNAIDGTAKWSFPTQGAIVATPVVAGGRVYVATFDQHVYALDEGTGSLVWQYPAAGAAAVPASWFWATPVLAGNLLLAPCMDHFLYALNTQDGSLAYKIDFTAPLISTPVIINDKGVVANENGTIYSIDAATGQA